MTSSMAWPSVARGKHGTGSLKAPCLIMQSAKEAITSTCYPVHFCDMGRCLTGMTNRAVTDNITNSLACKRT